MASSSISSISVSKICWILLGTPVIYWCWLINFEMVWQGSNTKFGCAMKVPMFKTRSHSSCRNYISALNTLFFPINMGPWASYKYFEYMNERWSTLDAERWWPAANWRKVNNVELGRGLVRPRWVWDAKITPSRGYIDGLVLERRNSIALAMELRLSCTNPPI